MLGASQDPIVAWRAWTVRNDTELGGLVRPEPWPAYERSGPNFKYRPKTDFK
jgi:hypothetical protein